MAKQAVKAAKGKVPDAVKAKGSKVAEAEEAKGTEVAIPAIKQGALSLDVGPKVLDIIGASARDERQVKELQAGLKTKEYDVQAALVQGIVKAAKADTSIRLENQFVDSKQGRSKLHTQLYLAMGFKSVVTVGKEGAQKDKVDWASNVRDLIAPQKDDADSIVKQKNTVRSNLSHQMTKAVQVALAIIDEKIDVKPHAETGSLLLTGPAIQDRFGAPSIVLNEKQTVPITDKKGIVTGEKELKAKPSFTEIARMAADAHGQVLTTRVQSGAGPTIDVNKHIVDLCGMLVKAVNKLSGELKPEVVQALESVYNAVDEKLD